MENWGCGRWMGMFAGGGRKQRTNVEEDGRMAVLVFEFQERFRGFSLSGKSGKDFCQRCHHSEKQVVILLSHIQQ